MNADERRFVVPGLYLKITRKEIQIDNYAIHFIYNYSLAFFTFKYISPYGEL